MLLVEEDERTVLLTGDGHAEDILRGLEEAGRLDEAGGIHLDVLKVQHHGSEHNLDPAFCRRVSADHYVFCANGAHENPDPRVIEAIIDSRLGPEEVRSENPGAERPFKLSFNASAETAPPGSGAEHMREVEKLVAAAVQRSGGRMSASFLTGPSLEIRL